MPFLTDMTAGSLKHKITIEKKSTASVDSEGVVNETWSTVLTAMAEYVTQSAKEYFQDASTTAVEIALFRIRYRSGIDKSMRVNSPFGIFNINTVVDVDGRHREIQLQCTTEAQNG